MKRSLTSRRRARKLRERIQDVSDRRIDELEAELYRLQNLPDHSTLREEREQIQRVLWREVS